MQVPMCHCPVSEATESTCVSHICWSQCTVPLKTQLQLLLSWTALNLFCPSGLIRHYLASHLSEVQSWPLFHSPAHLPCSGMVSVFFSFTPMSSTWQDGLSVDGGRSLKSMTQRTDTNQYRCGMMWTPLWNDVNTYMDFPLILSLSSLLQDGVLDSQAYLEDLCFVTDPSVCSLCTAISCPFLLLSGHDLLHSRAFAYVSNPQWEVKPSEALSLQWASEGLFCTKSPSSSVDRVTTYRIKQKGCLPVLFIVAD